MAESIDMKPEFDKEIDREFMRFKRLAFHDEELAKAKIWRDSNPDKTHRYYKKRWENNKESEYIRVKKWAKKNPLKIKAYSRAQRLKDPDKYREARRLDYRNNAERRKKTIKIWQGKNRHKKQQYWHQREILKRGLGEPTDCSDKIKLLRTECFCHWCCRPLTYDNRTIDHVVPLNRGGQHIPDNLVAACRPCNSSKSDKLIGEWQWVMHEEAA